MILFINYKHNEHLYQNHNIDLQGNMVHAIQKWNKIVDYLQAKTRSILRRNGMMCKDKWNSIHGDYKKITTTKGHGTIPTIGI